MATTIPLQLQIRTRITHALEGRASLREFYEWFVFATWEVERTGQADATRLTKEIAHLFSELSAGDMTPAEVVEELAPVVAIA